MRCGVVASSLQTWRHGVCKRGIIATGRRTQNTSGTSPRSKDSRRWAWRAPAITVDVDACSLLELVQHLLHPGACFPETPNPFKLCPTREPQLAKRFRLGGATFEPSEHLLSIHPEHLLPSFPSIYFRASTFETRDNYPEFPEFHLPDEGILLSIAASAMLGPFAKWELPVDQRS
jgi:hypothetical protein